MILLLTLRCGGVLISHRRQIRFRQLTQQPSDEYFFFKFSLYEFTMLV